jgi:hypothetical protein
MRVVPAANGLASSRGRALAPLLLLLAAAPACTLNQEGVPPPLDRISFPGSALVDPDGRWLYVANSNADLRYNNGTLVAVDLNAVAADRVDTPTHPAPWTVCPGADYVRKDTDTFPCCWDFLDHTILDCDERKYIPIDSTIEIGSFSAGMVFQPFTEPTCPPNLMSPTDRHDCNAHCPGDTVDGRLFIGVRGNSSLTYVDTSRVLDAALGKRPSFGLCTPPGGSPGACMVNQMPGPVGIPATGTPPVVAPTLVPDEPYALALDLQQDLLYVGHLRGDVNHPDTGGISLFDVSRPTAYEPGHEPYAPPKFLGASPSVFNADGNGNFGITSLTLRNGEVYASSRYVANVVNVVPSLDAPSCTSPQDPMTITVSAGSDVFTTPLVGTEIRGIQFLDDARAFALQRVPPALVGFDTSKDPAAFGNFASDVIETCSAPTFLQAFDAGEGMRLYVTCFDAGQIYVFDPDVPRLVTVIDTGRGPAGLAFAPSSQDPAAPRLAFIVGFSLNSIGVLDLTPGSPTQYHVIQRLGFPSLEPR